ncbi:MAG: HIT family protein [Candidatus Nomurabacteria bacterium]|jgi:diadenosine tetraphosphate (Ap4A) HIT family hydrolase|nr:HIT family protein [Candidatus Nomurabacteria bacterium]
MELFETEYWQVKLSSDQANLGKCVVVAKSEPSRLADLTDLEWTDFGKVVNRLEKAISKTFQPSHFNWKCLSNDAFNSDGSQKYAPAIHWHFMPRYATAIKIADETFVEPEFPKTVKTEKFVPDSVLAEIAEKIQNNL